ncbi:HD domain-containing protein, partial [Erythrobacter sp.]|uniref:HD domain-containing protein n=1 Tax=Erythrobacter sp. TaxID=1042 RepID=UPI003C711A9F
SHQPRAGVTGPGRPRRMLQPEENHAEHSFVVALYAGLLAPFYAADPARAFWHGMIHHLHSIAMPDAGFTGEVLLGDRLDAVIDRARELALERLPDMHGATCRDHLNAIADDTTPSARAFHAADVIDRVVEIEHHLKRSEVTMAVVLGDYGLVHDGPVKTFHDRVLAEVGLP